MDSSPPRALEERLRARRSIAAIQATAEEEWWRSVKATISARREAGVRTTKPRPGEPRPDKR